MFVKLSIGEVLDKLSILRIKLKNIKDPIKLSNIQKEESYLVSILSQDLLNEPLLLVLQDVNNKLWDAEDSIRNLEELGDFTEKFIEVARSIYTLNDYRFSIKRKINLKYGSDLLEEKSFNI